MSDFAKDTNVPTNDCISRQAAINAICSVCGADAECDKSKFVYDAQKEKQVIMCPDHYELTHLPSVEPKWIPVTERLPEKEAFYLVSLKRGGVTTDKWMATTETFRFYESSVVAWMPLPEPYEGGDPE